MKPTPIHLRRISWCTKYMWFRQGLSYSMNWDYWRDPYKAQTCTCHCCRMKCTNPTMHIPTEGLLLHLIVLTVVKPHKWYSQVYEQTATLSEMKRKFQSKIFIQWCNIARVIAWKFQVCNDNINECFYFCSATTVYSGMPQRLKKGMSKLSSNHSKLHILWANVLRFTYR